TALNRIGRADPATWVAIVGGLAHVKPAVRDGVWMALRETHQAALVRALGEFAHDRRKPPEAGARALRLLAAARRLRTGWKGEGVATHPPRAPPPAKTRPWEGTPTVLTALRDGIEDPDAGVRLAVVEGLREVEAAGTAPKLRARFSDERDPVIR